MNGENEWVQIAETIDGPIERVMREEIMEMFKHLKIGKSPGPTVVYAEMILARGDVGIRDLMELGHRILDGKRMPDDWSTSAVIPIFKVKGDIMNCGMYREVKLLEQAMKIIEKLPEKRLRKVVTIDDIQFGFISGKDTNHSVFILRRIQEEYLAKQKKMYMCFVDPEKAFDKVPKKVV